jgi:hypothetical protein
MTQRRRDTKAILRIVARSERRSPLFHWMVEHHDELVEASGRDGIQWASFCAEAAKRGLTDTRGLPPAPDNARKTWAQARRAVREARAELAARPPKPVYPSRMPKGWVPPEILAAIESGNPAVEGARVGRVVPAPGTAVVAVDPPPSPVPPAKPEAGKTLSRYAKPEDPPEVQAAYAAIEEQLDQADWWLMGGTGNKRRSD